MRKKSNNRLVYREKQSRKRIPYDFKIDELELTKVEASALGKSKSLKVLREFKHALEGEKA